MKSKLTLLNGCLYGLICTKLSLTIKAVSKYLVQYAEPEVIALPTPENAYFDRCLVIPAFAESTEFIQRISDTWGNDDKLLIVLVINRPDHCDSATHAAADLCLEEAKNTLPKIILSHRTISWRHTTNSKSFFLMVDRCSSSPIPAKQGVGLARKIGCDIALKLFSLGRLKSEWVSTTDADAHLPEDYFEQRFNSGSAKIFPHRYRDAEPALVQATKIYDARNSCYQRELTKAGSVYGYNPTGSLLALHLPSYAQVRGFPKRAGGEDFYLLNKLQKINGVQSPEMTPVELECRISSRVPFGTGPAVEKLLASDNPQSEPIFYHPKCFEVFRTGLAVLQSTHPEQWLKSIDMPGEFSAALQSIDITSAQRHLSPFYENNREGSADKSEGRGYRYHLDLWFDAFQTLKTIHFLRDNYFGSVSYTDWLQLAAD